MTSGDKIRVGLFTKILLDWRWRRRRMLQMNELLRLPRWARIIDLGGSEWNWQLFDHDYHVTLVNLPGFLKGISDPSRFRMVEGDACDLRGVFEDRSFDAVFSNSTIEHVGDESRQDRFAAEVLRLAPAYWVQTPSDRFPIEAHTNIPFYWSLPSVARAAILRRWERKVPHRVMKLRQTRVLSRKRMHELFPGAQVFVERVVGLEKSYSFYRPYVPTAGPNGSGRPVAGEISETNP